MATFLTALKAWDSRGLGLAAAEGVVPSHLHIKSPEVQTNLLLKLGKTYLDEGQQNKKEEIRWLDPRQCLRTGGNAEEVWQTRIGD